MKNKVLLSIIAVLSCLSLRSTAQDNVYFCSENFSASGKPINQLALKPKDEGGKKVLNVQPAKGAMKMFAFGAFLQDEELSKSFSKTTYRAKSPFQYAEGKSIDGNDRLVELESNVLVLYVPGKEPKVKMAFAKDEASAKEWAGEKGLNAVKELEKLANNKQQKELADKFEKDYANSWMPKPGKLHTAENEAKAKKVIEDRILRDGGTIQKVVIVSDDWDVVRNKNTGIVTGRVFYTIIAETHPDRPEGWCMKFICSIHQQHDGSGFAGDWKCTGVGQTLKYGPLYIHTRDLNNAK